MMNSELEQTGLSKIDDYPSRRENVPGLNGYIDKVSWKSVMGWAYSPKQKVVDVEVSADGVPIGSTQASEYRPDLEAGGFGNGKHGFYFELTKEYRNKSITCRIIGTNFELALPTESNSNDEHTKWTERRKRKLLANIELGIDKGIEFGPLCFPLINPNTNNIRYIDHASTEDLKKKYNGDTNVNIREIVDINYVWTGQPLKELIGDFAPIDYAVAVHVLEHVPNIIGWLQDVHSILKNGGTLSLALPDKRFCFDYNRQLTGPEHLIEAHLKKYVRPSPRMIFDHYANVVSWKGDVSWYTWQPRPVVAEFCNAHTIEEAMAKATVAATTDTYLDAHCWVFTAESFLTNMKILIDLGLLPYKIDNFFATDGNEFIVCLKAMPLEPTPEEIEVQKMSATQAIASLPI